MSEATQILRKAGLHNEVSVVFLSRVNVIIALAAVVLL